MKLNMVATCLFGLEHMLGEEIDKLGLVRTSTADGRVSFTGDESALVSANLWLRYAERVYIELGQFNASTFDELFEGTKALPWEQFISKNDAFPVKGHSVRSTLTSIPSCQKIIKKAISKRLGERYGLTWLPEDSGVLCQVVFFLMKDRVSLLIDTSGDPLYKRGYRSETGDAPLRETLACAIVSLSRPRDEVLLWDPCCGSGTIAIEAALRQNNIAPGIARRFAFEAFPWLPSSLLSLAREEAKDAVRKSEFEAFASDIDPRMVEIAKENARRAGVAGAVNVFCQDATKITKPDRRGTIVTNPPYGERLGSLKEAEDLYRAMGKTFSAMSPYQIYVLTSHEGFERFYGKKADKVRKIYNGMLPCYFYQYFKNK